MPGKLRIFISSTMDDLENERAVVVQQLKSSNFEPVNAEGILPNGATSWDRISEELEACHVMVLLSGVRYGWIPRAGPLAADNVSVTHGEYNAAKKLGLPVLTFFKELSYRTDRTSDDAQRREKFRSEIEDWVKGEFRTTFRNVIDLPEKINEAVVRMLTDVFQRDLITKRRKQTPEPPPPLPPRAVPVPERLVEGVAGGKAILWVGSGISIGAGLPSTHLLASELVRSIRERFPAYSPPATGWGIASIASDFEQISDRAHLLKELNTLLDLPGGVQPTAAHRNAVTLFPRIITTNYDRLLEAAAKAEGTGHEVVIGPALPNPRPAKFIWKIHGTLDGTHLVMTELDLEKFQATRDAQTQLEELFQSGPVLVGGTTLRDPSAARLFGHARKVLDGYWAVIPGDVVAQMRANSMNLRAVPGMIDEILAALDGAARVTG
jgi:hypothetical protein